MKLLTTVCSIVFFASIVYSQSDSLPPEARKLKEAYRAAIAKANEPITRNYLAKLEEMKANFMKNAQLAEAVAIEKEIAMIKQAEISTAISSDPILGKWIWRQGVFVEVSADGTVASTDGTRGKWITIRKPNGDIDYEISWERGKVVDQFSLSRDGKRLLGKNSRGDRIEVRRSED